MVKRSRLPCWPPWLYHLFRANCRITTDDASKGGVTAQRDLTRCWRSMVWTLIEHSTEANFAIPAINNNYYTLQNFNYFNLHARMLRILKKHEWMSCVSKCSSDKKLNTATCEKRQHENCSVMQSWFHTGVRGWTAYRYELPKDIFAKIIPWEKHAYVVEPLISPSRKRSGIQPEKVMICIY